MQTFLPPFRCERARPSYYGFAVYSFCLFYPPLKALSDDEIFRMAEQQAERAIQRERRLEDLKNGFPGPPPPIPTIVTTTATAKSAPTPMLPPAAAAAEAAAPSEPTAFTAAVTARLSRELSLKEAETAMLRRENERLKAEANELRRRAEDGEAKEKFELLLEIEELKKVRVGREQVAFSVVS